MVSKLEYLSKLEARIETVDPSLTATVCFFFLIMLEMPKLASLTLVSFPYNCGFLAQ